MYKEHDAIILNLMCNYLQQAIEKFYLNFKSKANINRSLKILDDVTPLLAESDYSVLQYKMEKTFAEVFNFKQCQILFKEPAGMNLYRINAGSEAEFERIAEKADYTEQNVQKLAANKGYTRKAIDLREV